MKVHKVPDYAYFNDSVHVNSGVSCVNCHGKVNEMPVVFHDQAQSMSWCLDCHRNPEAVPAMDKITNLNWTAEWQGKTRRTWARPSRRRGKFTRRQLRRLPPLSPTNFPERDETHLATS